ncbi:hypothetical protein ILUMI_19677 [Ignelater luminosus]|uniref:MD-2-related lipid-recognition domain-containing protein n=1 Tax=Ignelater luminosus TaxID=2038154 RepID=A0A8K0G5M3_IGNLU|nr:hypothetical protein ILUMI_19677 [Ignelater luminosus]
MPLNACEELPKNIFGIYDMLKTYTNADRCPFKMGNYYIRHGVFNVSKLPPYLPRGQYKAEIKGYNNKDYVGEVNIIATVIDL